LPLALLEYGMASLPVVATRVGQCDEVLGSGRCGMLVPPGEPAPLAQAILELLGSTHKRKEFGSKLNARVQRAYSRESVIQKVTDVYETVLSCRLK
jgi:glycosyltransferase involved in cell wall biosynthesis